MKACERCGQPPKDRLRRGLCESDYDKWRRRQHGYGRFAELSDYTPAQPARDHVRALRAAGVGLGRIAELSGLPRRTVQEVGSRDPKTIRKGTADALLAVTVPWKPHGEQVAANTFIDPTGTIRRVQALMLAGHSMASLTRLMGYVGNPLTYFMNGHRKFITAAFARKVDALFVELEEVPGTCDRARVHAEKRGWAPAIAWDEDTIDDPKAKPQHNIQRRVSFAEQYEELLELARAKEAADVARELAMTRENAERQIQRYRAAQRKAIAS